MAESSALLNPSLQYGAFAVLLAFVIGFVIIQRERDKKSDSRQAETDDFIRNLVERTMAAYDAQIIAYQTLTKEGVIAQQAMTHAQQTTIEVLKEISEQVKDNGHQNAERHNAIMRRLDREPFNAKAPG